MKPEGCARDEDDGPTDSGNWDAGYALDKHTLSSTYIGDNEHGHAQFDTVRTEVGEALYQLKYKKDFGQVDSLAEAIEEHLIPKFEQIGLVIPMPATNHRARQPVNEVAKALAKRLKVNSFENIRVKTPGSAGQPSLKNLAGKEAKAEAMKGRFAIDDVIQGDGCWNALIVDDLFDTGASMEAACATLRTYNKIGKIFVAALTWK
jgi:predicted amidophosphoribosyltransferase